MSSFTSIAMMVIPGLAWLIIASEWSFEVPLIGVLFKPWRLLQIAYGLPSIIFAACIFLLPESPKYLLANGKETEALLILRKMYTLNTGKSSVEFPVIRLLLDEDIADVKNNKGFFRPLFKQTCSLFSKQFAIKTFAICILQFGVVLVTFGFYLWYPEVMNHMRVFERENIGEKSSICRAIKYQSVHKHSTNETVASTCKEEMKPEAFTVSFLMGAFFTVTYLTIGSLINIVGKKNVLLLLFVTSALSGLTAQCLSGSTIVDIFMGCALLSSIGGSVIIAIVVDLYPTHIRAMALAVSLMFGELGAVCGMHLSGLIFYDLCNFAYPIFAAFHIVVIVLVLLLLTSANIPKMIEPIM
ncbi:hypothetical protein PPYR_05976 [Photinus pyralis]|uniref:Major facilitator superfamily (MFS) profile domain-containing protein n=2 Tax=Photinus pyralis TaxID=7054 RepID=A0A5N4ASE4_PHOPY|nr:hypothetical protein PPYR_05976 [Photinus pyralis]